MTHFNKIFGIVAIALTVGITPLSSFASTAATASTPNSAVQSYLNGVTYAPQAYQTVTCPSSPAIYAVVPVGISWSVNGRNVPASMLTLRMFPNAASFKADASAFFDPAKKDSAYVLTIACSDLQKMPLRNFAPQAPNREATTLIKYADSPDVYLPVYTTLGQNKNIMAWKLPDENVAQAIDGKEWTTDIVTLESWTKQDIDFVDWDTVSQQMDDYHDWTPFAFKADNSPKVYIMTNGEKKEMKYIPDEATAERILETSQWTTRVNTMTASDLAAWTSVGNVE
jgi:hypothetical protein